ncbi:hypothetical protein EDB92DRAFT_1870255 [Lactarius akahatsu]|uniref:Uncharacterized protein n=1 Tax=Lactarius akahatsu TaxID=416441 RepID=A0AAD4LEK5_9AGAM|nr:hypothetical protein EDB92DRAFT_1870255 [Lactarius akahatsu]
MARATTCSSNPHLCEIYWFSPKGGYKPDNFGSCPPHVLCILGEGSQRPIAGCTRPWQLAVSTTGAYRHSPSLGLKHFFFPQILLAYDIFKSCAFDPVCGGVVVSIQPKIRKSCFFFYLLLRLLNEKKSVAFQVGDRFILFQLDGTGAELRNATDVKGHLIPGGTWALTDSEMPCPSFLSASMSRRAYIIQTTAPLEYDEMSEPWRRECSMIFEDIEVETMSSAKLTALRKTLDLDPKILVTDREALLRSLS